MVTLVSAPGLLVFLVARSSFFTWATASIEPLNKRALNRIRFISDVVPFSRYVTLKRVYNARYGRSRKVLMNAVIGEVGTGTNLAQRTGSLLSTSDEKLK